MDSKHLCILGCTLVVAFFGTKPVIHYIDSKKEENLVKIINILADKIPEANYIKQESESLREKIIKNSTQFQDGIKYNRHYIANEDIIEKAKHTREKAVQVRLDGTYKIVGIDYEDDYTRFSLEVIDVKRLENGYKFYAYLYNDMLKEESNFENITFKPFYENKIFDISVNGGLLKNIVTDATIYKINHQINNA